MVAEELANTSTSHKVKASLFVFLTHTYRPLILDLHFTTIGFVEEYATSPHSVASDITLVVPT